jgi:hypothetical protein
MNLEKAEIVEIVEFMKEALNAKCLNKKTFCGNTPCIKYCGDKKSDEWGKTTIEKYENGYHYKYFWNLCDECMHDEEMDAERLY